MSGEDCLLAIAEAVLGQRHPHWYAFSLDALLSRVRELVAAQPQPVVPGPLPTEKLEPGVRIWKSPEFTAVATTDNERYTIWNLFHDIKTYTSKTSMPSSGKESIWVECRIVAPPIKLPKSIPPKPARVLARIQHISGEYSVWRWYSQSDAHPTYWSIGGSTYEWNRLIVHPTCDDPEHLAGLEVLKRQQGGE